MSDWIMPENMDSIEEAIYAASIALYLKDGQSVEVAHHRAANAVYHWRVRRA